MKATSERRTEIAAGIAALALGIGATAIALGYRVGSLSDIGPGFFPTVLGVMLAAVGCLILASAFWSGERAATVEEVEIASVLAHAHPERSGLDLRGWACIIAGIVAFIVLGAYGGLAPAAFACVFISAWGDRSATWRGTLTLSTGLTVFGLLLFKLFLDLPLPMWRWG